MGTDPWGFDEERQNLAWRLRGKRRWLSAGQTGVLLAYLLVLLAGASLALRSWASSLPVPRWTVPSIFLAVLFLVGSVLGWPFAYARGFKLDHAFGLSTQRLRAWALDQLKSFALGLGAVIAAGDVLLWLLSAEPVWWWLIAWMLGLVVTLVLGFLAPVALAPLFYRFRPLRDPSLRARFEALAARAGVPVLGVFEMGASAKTRRSNAAVVGFGRTRRIIVTDTLLQGSTPDEIETVLAHELGHQRHYDPLEGVAVGAAVSSVMWGVAALAYTATHAAFGFPALGDMAGLPLLLLYSGIVAAALGPLELWWSRRRESRADRFSLKITENPKAFASEMVKLHDANLGIAHPRPWEEWFFYSHPSGRQRVESARSFEAHQRRPV